MATEPDLRHGQLKGGYKDRFWYPRFWDGMVFSGIVREVVRNRFMIAPRRVGMALIMGVLGVLMHAPLGFLQALIWGRRIRQTEIEQDPIFIIGHWRAGTTLLHELMILDRRHTYPSTYACFAPSHYLLTKSVFPPTILRILSLPSRPQDNMAFGWDRPQEDEFALCNLGIRSPYLTMMFPNRPPQDQEYLDMEGVSAHELARWKEGLLWFLKCITLENPKRIVLKSPPHTCRIKVLLEMFPKARFVHIYRDPYVVFPSTVNLWKRLYRDQGLQKPKYEGLEEHVFETFNRMYQAFQRDRPLIGPGQLCEVGYEQLVADPVGQMRRIYEELDLRDFESVLPALEQFLASQAGYKTNRYQISPETRAEIIRRWAWFIEKYGYSSSPAEV